MCELFVVNDSPEVGQHNNNAACFGRFFLIMYSLRQMPADGINSHLRKKEHSPKMNSTPFVRQYGILLTNGVLLYAKREAKQEIHRGV